MTTYFQNASVAYSRINGTILSHSFDKTPAIPLAINASQILQAYDALLFDTTRLMNVNGAILPVRTTDLPLFSGTMFPAFLWMSEPAFIGTNAINPATSNQAFTTLQALLAMPMCLCQNGFTRGLFSLTKDSKSMGGSKELQSLSALLSPPAERVTPVSFAYHRYEAVASMPTLIAYIALSGTTLLLCALAQLLSSKMVRGSGRLSMPHLTQFSALDLFSHCTIEDENHCVVFQGRSGVFHDKISQESQLGWLSTLKVKWSRPSSTGNGLQLFNSFEADKRSDQDIFLERRQSPFRF
jgi:hypothetical protein